MERRRFTALSLGFLLLLPAQSVFPVMYKWYDEQGKVNYTQTPPPKGSRQTSINTDTYSSVEMRTVPVVKRVTKPRREAVRRKTRPRKTNSSCPRRR